MGAHDVDATVSQAPAPRAGLAARAKDSVTHRYTTKHRNGPKWRAFRPVRLITDIVLCLAVLLVAVAGVGIATGRLQLRPVLSGSMGHTLPLGSVAVIERIPTSSIAVGDILALRHPGTAGTTYVHRVIRLGHRPNGELVVQTKGDANKVPDPASVTIVGPYAYRVEHDIPWVGYAAVWLHNRPGGALLFGGGLILVVGGWLMYRAVREREKATGDNAADDARDAGEAPEQPAEDVTDKAERSLVPWAGWQQ